MAGVSEKFKRLIYYEATNYQTIEKIYESPNSLVYRAIFDEIINRLFLKFLKKTTPLLQNLPAINRNMKLLVL